MYHSSPSPIEGYVKSPFWFWDFSTMLLMSSTSLPPRLSREPSIKHTTSLFTQLTSNTLMDSESPWLKWHFPLTPNTVYDDFHQILWRTKNLTVSRRSLYNGLAFMYPTNKIKSSSRLLLRTITLKGFCFCCFKSLTTFQHLWNLRNHPGIV